MFPTEEANLHFAYAVPSAWATLFPYSPLLHPQLLAVPGIAKCTLLQEALLDLQVMLAPALRAAEPHTPDWAWLGQAPLASVLRCEHAPASTSHYTATAW